MLEGSRRLTADQEAVVRAAAGGGCGAWRPGTGKTYIAVVGRGVYGTAGYNVLALHDGRPGLVSTGRPRGPDRDARRPD